MDWRLVAVPQLVFGNGRCAFVVGRVVVICHDALLKRIYGVDAAVTSLPWKNGLDQLRTIREPHSPMLRFRQLCEKLASAEDANGVGGTRTAWKDAQIMMDIKVCPN